MAKSRSVKKVHGATPDLTLVKSRAYGDHLRARRGTYKQADVNDAFKRESKILQSANIPAKIFKDAIDKYRGHMPGGMLWQRLVSMFRKQLRDQRQIDVGILDRFEIYADHPLERLLRVQSTFRLENNNTALRVNISYNNHPVFVKGKSADGYMFSIIAIFPDLKKLTAKTVAVTSNVIKFSEPIALVQTEVPVPAKAKSFIICLRIEGCVGDKVSNMRSTTGMRVLATGRI